MQAKDPSTLSLLPPSPPWPLANWSMHWGVEKGTGERCSTKYLVFFCEKYLFSPVPLSYRKRKGGFLEIWVKKTFEIGKLNRGRVVGWVGDKGGGFASLSSQHIPPDSQVGIVQSRCEMYRQASNFYALLLEKAFMKRDYLEISIFFCTLVYNAHVCLPPLAHSPPTPPPMFSKNSRKEEREEGGIWPGGGEGRGERGRLIGRTHRVLYVPRRRNSISKLLSSKVFFLEIFVCFTSWRNVSVEQFCSNKI